MHSGKHSGICIRGCRLCRIPAYWKNCYMMIIAGNTGKAVERNTYDALIAEFRSDEELEQEKEIFKSLDYRYFRDNFGLPDLPRKIDEQIIEVRKFLKVATLSVFKKKDMAVSFRSASNKISDANVVKANAMVQIAGVIML